MENSRPNATTLVEVHRFSFLFFSLRKLVEYMADGIFGEGKRKQTSTKRDGGRKGPSKSRKPRETRHATFGLTLPARKRRKREDRLIQR